MNILFVSKNLVAADLCRTLIREGNQVKLYIENKKDAESFEGFVEKTNNWETELGWVGKQGLIVFDDVGYGKKQDKLRLQGYRVVGGSEITDKLETDREYAQKVFQKLNFSTTELHDFTNLSDAIEFVKKNPKRWVVKQNDGNSKDITYIGVMENGKDVVSLLETYNSDDNFPRHTITLHEFAEGVEIGVGRFFNGNNWVGPIEINLEHKRLFPGNIGPITSEMGTLAWYTENEKNILFQTILAPWKDFLQQANFKGDFEINCIVNKNKIIPLEITPRFGSPIVHLQEEIHESPWCELLSALADGVDYDLQFKKQYGIVMLLAVPPFPYSQVKNINEPLKNLSVFFDCNMTEAEKHIHFEEVMRDKVGNYRIIGTSGYVGYVSSTGDTVSEARNKSISIINQIHIPRVMYRNDIGKDFETWQMKKLLEWNIISKKDLPNKNRFRF